MEALKPIPGKTAWMQDIRYQDERMLKSGESNDL
jgi:hypothetical protein